jgi:hypothetical protein
MESADSFEALAFHVIAECHVTDNKLIQIIRSVRNKNYFFLMEGMGSTFLTYFGFTYVFTLNSLLSSRFRQNYVMLSP